VPSAQHDDVGVAAVSCSVFQYAPRVAVCFSVWLEDDNLAATNHSHSHKRVLSSYPMRSPYLMRSLRVRFLSLALSCSCAHALRRASFCLR